MKDKIQISKQEICELISKDDLPRVMTPWFKSTISIRPLSWPWNMVKGSCVELKKDSYGDLDLYVLNQSSPLNGVNKRKSIDKDLQVSLQRRGDLYVVDKAVAFRHGYYADSNPEPVSLIFNTAVECVKDLVERGQTRYQENRFSQLKRDLKAIVLRSL